MKRLLTLFLALVMIAGCLAGCGGEQSANNDQSGDANNPEAIDWPKKDIEIAAAYCRRHCRYLRPCSWCHHG